MACLCTHARVRHVDGGGRCQAMTARARKCSCVTFTSELEDGRYIRLGDWKP